MVVEALHYVDEAEENPSDDELMMDLETETEVVPRDFTVILMKPMAVENGLVGEIMDRLVNEGGCSITAYKLGSVAEKCDVAEHYAESQYKNGEPTPYYPGLVNYMSEKVIDIFILEDLGQSSDGRSLHDRLRQDLIGPSNPEDAADHHIRAMARDYEYRKEVDIPPEEAVPGSGSCIDNLIHCSDSIDSAMREVGVWFKDQPEVISKCEDAHRRIKDGSESIDK